MQRKKKRRRERKHRSLLGVERVFNVDVQLQVHKVGVQRKS